MKRFLACLVLFLCIVLAFNCERLAFWLANWFIVWVDSLPSILRYMLTVLSYGILLGFVFLPVTIGPELIMQASERVSPSRNGLRYRSISIIYIILSILSVISGIIEKENAPYFVDTAVMLVLSIRILLLAHNQFPPIIRHAHPANDPCVKGFKEGYDEGYADGLKKRDEVEAKLKDLFRQAGFKDGDNQIETVDQLENFLDRQARQRAESEQRLQSAAKQALQKEVNDLRIILDSHKRLIADNQMELLFEEECALCAFYFNSIPTKFPQKDRENVFYEFSRLSARGSGEKLNKSTSLLRHFSNLYQEKLTPLTHKAVYSYLAEAETMIAGTVPPVFRITSNLNAILLIADQEGIKISPPELLKESEPVYLVETDDGMLIRVPASKLDDWQEAQRTRATEPLSEAEKELKERLLRRIYGGKE